MASRRNRRRNYCVTRIKQGKKIEKGWLPSCDSCEETREWVSTDIMFINVVKLLQHKFEFNIVLRNTFFSPPKSLLKV